jgi:hypothetical protein
LDEGRIEVLKQILAEGIRDFTPANSTIFLRNESEHRSRVLPEIN